MAAAQPDTATPRRFAVHGLAEPAARAHVVEGASFEDAALQFVEDWRPAAEDDELSLIVEDCQTGERQCFRIDLETGETAPCS
jgi:hypothetical protein